MLTIRNPVLPGFYPDPSICRVGDEYYIVNSTFEWFPGVPIHRSKDLVHWQFAGHVLTRRSQLDLLGVGDSAGVWAPSLSYSGGTYFLIYTLVRTRVGNFKDVPNFLVTAPSIEGPWSDPIFLNASGFDPSLFHDEADAGGDGRKWLANMLWDFRGNGRSKFAGILLQEYSHEQRKLVGPIKKILQKPILSEGPNLYKRDGYYYLMLAEGGTGWNHGIAMARSRSIDGPYELDPQPLVMTSRKDGGLALQKAGHGELVETPAGEWYLVHLASRPVFPERRCVLGRETCLQKVEWSADGWLRLAGGGTDPKVEVPAPRDAKPHPWPPMPTRDDFDAPQLDAGWCALRVPINASWATTAERPGWLRLRGRESIASLFEQSLLAKRLTATRCVAQTCVEFDPPTFLQSAGLIVYYDTRQNCYLRVTRDEHRGKVLGLVVTDDGAYSELAASDIPVDDWPRCHLRATIDDERLQFAASPDGRTWQNVGGPQDVTKLSDDYGQGLRFTGTLAGVCAQDLNGTRTTADFDYFELTNA